MTKLSLIAILLSCLILGVNANPSKHHKKPEKSFQTGAERTELYVNYLKHKNVAMVINPTSVMGQNHMPVLDSLIKLGIHITKIFGPEHGFRGNASNGAAVNDEVDVKTGIPAIS